MKFLSLSAKIVGVVYIVSVLTLILVILSDTALARPERQSVQERAYAVKVRKLQRLEAIDKDIQQLIPNFKAEIERVLAVYADKMRVSSTGI